MTVALRILLALYILQALAKFTAWLVVPYERRIKQMARNYSKGGRLIEASDYIVLALQAVLVALLAAGPGLEHLSFITGLMVGLTLTQLFFHRFNQPLPPDRAPDPPASPIKTMSYAIQANPALARSQIILQTALFAWALFMLATQPA
jgi:hypothetical protein